MRKPDYKADVMMKAVQAGIEPDIYDDVVVWDNNGHTISTGLLLKKTGTDYMVLAYFDEPQVFTWNHAVKIEET